MQGVDDERKTGFPPSIVGEEIMRESSLDTKGQMIENGIQLVIV